MMLSPAPPPFGSSGFTPTLNSEYFFNDDPSVSSQSPLFLGGTYDQSNNQSNQPNDPAIDSPPLQLNDHSINQSNHPSIQHQNYQPHGRSIIEQTQRSQRDAGAYLSEPSASILSMANPTFNTSADHSNIQSHGGRPAINVAAANQQLTQPRPVRLAPPAVTQPSSPVLYHHTINQSCNQPRHTVTQTAPSSPILSTGHSIARPISGQDGPLEYVGPFVLGPVLGRGCTGTVRLGTHRMTGFEVAFKIIEKKYLNSEPKLWKKVKREIAILKLIEHPFVLRLYDVLETEHRLYLVLEHVKGGELFDYIVSKGRLDRNESLRLTAQIVQGLEHCHAHSICHRDLKPENLLLDEAKNIKIADFGMAQLMRQNSILKTSCGSPHYASPEIIEGNNYDARVTDVWSIGVILYALFTGSLPFDHDNIPTLLSMVTKGIYNTPAHVPSDVSHLISRMLTVDPQKRIKLTEIRGHPAFKGTNHFSPIRGDSWPFNLVKQPSSNQTSRLDPAKHRTVAHSDIPCDSSEASCDSSDDDSYVDDNLIADLEALGISSSTNRDELKAKITNRTGQSNGDVNNIERRFYHLLKKRRHSRLSQLSMLSPKVSPRAMMSNSYSGASSSSTFSNGPFFHRAQSQPEAEHEEGGDLLPVHASAPSSRNVSSNKNDEQTVTVAVTPEMMPAGHWVERTTMEIGSNAAESSELRSEIPISPLELDDDIDPPHYSSYQPQISRLHSAPSPSREIDARSYRTTIGLNQVEESAAQFYSRLASGEPESPHGIPITIDSMTSSAPSSPASSFGLTSPISASAPQSSMMSAVSAQAKAQRMNQAMGHQAVNQLELPKTGFSHARAPEHTIARRLFEGDGPEIRIDNAASPARSIPHHTSSHQTTTADRPHIFSTPRFHRVRVDPGLADQSSSSTSHASGTNLGSPVKKSSWFSSIFSGKTNLNLFARSNKHKTPKSPTLSSSTQSTRASSSKPVAGLLSTKTTLTIADEVRRALKHSGVHYSMKQAGLAGGSRFECKVGDAEKKTQTSSHPGPSANEVRPWSRRFSTTTMEVPRSTISSSINQTSSPSRPRANVERRGSVGTALWGTAPISFTTSNTNTFQSPARPPRHRSRPASPVVTPPTHTRHSSYLTSNQPVQHANDHIINIGSSGGRSRANSDELDIERAQTQSAQSNNLPNQHVRFVVEITHTNDHRCVRFIHVSGDEAQFKQWQSQISAQLHL